MDIDSLEARQGGISSDVRKERIDIKMQLEEIYLQEEIKWAQKAKKQWVKEGDSNTKFFHKIAIGHRVKSTINRIQTMEGRIVEKPRRY